MECQHGQLARACELCECYTEIEELKQRIKELEEDNADICAAYNAVREENERYREALEKIADLRNTKDVHEKIKHCMANIAKQAISTTKD